MNIENRLEALNQKHSALDAQIQSLEAQAAGDDQQINQLKKNKLLLKDEIEKLRISQNASK